jgi:hypothetical protein
LFLAAGADTLILKTEYLPSATTQNFSASSNRHIFVGGNTGTVDVTTASNGYYRIKSGDVFTEGEYITGDYFQNVTQLPVGQWVIEEGNTISFTAVSPTLIDVTLIATTETFIVTIIMTLMLSALLFCFGLLIANDF